MRILLLLFCLGMTSWSSAQKSILISNLDAYLATLPSHAKISFQIESLRGKVYANYHAEEAVPSASVIKIPILVELMEQVKIGKQRLSDNYTLLETDKTGGSGIIANYENGTILTLDELARLMMVASDNTATNIIIRKVGQKAVNDRMKQLGLPHLQLNRVMMDTAAVARGIDNYVTVSEINKLLRLIFNKKVATPDLCKRMMAFLLANEDATTLPRLIPKDIKVAHKTGGLVYVRGDAGVVFTQKPFVISVFVRETTTEMAEKIIGEIGEISYLLLK
ncbi:MAG: serine hydrolase [Spirosomataceae bacterium]